MTKFWLILYTCVTSLVYTGLVAVFTKKIAEIPLAFSIPILIAVAALIAFGRERIADIDHEKKIEAKDNEISALKVSVKQKQAMLHSVKSKVIHVAINVSDKDEFLVTMREIASMLNENLAINNLEFEAGTDGSGYLDLLTMGARAKI